MSYREKRRDGPLMLATIRDDTWNQLNIQHITPNSKRWDHSDTLDGGHKKVEQTTETLVIWDAIAPIMMLP